MRAPQVDHSEISVAMKGNRPPNLLPRQELSRRLAIKLGVPALITSALTILSANNNSILQIFLAFLLLVIPWTSYQHWLVRRSVEFPLFSLIAAYHWLFFAVALFVGDRVSPIWYSNSAIVSEDSITKSLFMAVLGMVVLGIGMRLHWGILIPRLSIPKPQIDLDWKWDYVRVMLIAGTILSLFPDLVYVFGEAGRQFIVAYQNTMPILAALILLRRYLKGQANQLDKALLIVYIFVRVIVGLASGWSGAVFYFGVALGLMYFFTMRRVPIRIILLFLLISLLIQPNKGDFRAKFWYSDEREAGVITRVSYWLEESVISWTEALNDPTREKLNGYLRYSILRVSLLNHAANVHDKTPEIVPYQGLSLYRFTVAGLVPRFLWPDKPSANEANRFFQVAYGVTPEDRLGDVSIAIGFLTESYISLGWIGVVLIMLFVGGIYSSTQRAFFSDFKDPILPAIGIVVVLRFLDIESQFGRYFVGIVQTVIYCYIFMLPLMFRIRSRPSSGELQDHNALH